MVCSKLIDCLHLDPSLTCVLADLGQRLFFSHFVSVSEFTDLDKMIEAMEERERNNKGSPIVPPRRTLPLFLVSGTDGERAFTGTFFYNFYTQSMEPGASLTTSLTASGTTSGTPTATRSATQ